MRCYKCNSLLDNNDYCLKCGADVSAYKIIVRASNIYYNQGLEKAQVRDLTGAVEYLRKSLCINKKNIKARNLLGLVYFEMGEVVMALSEWVISKNIKPERNVAGVYIDKVQADPNKLETMNQAVKRFNIALKAVKEGNNDVALIQLKKVITMNSRFVKAGLLLGLLYINKGEKDKARKVLKRVLTIDRNNTMALRYLDEINGTGIAQIKDEDDGIIGKKGRKNKQEKTSGNDVIIPPNSYKEPSNGVFTVLSILLGVIIGAALVWYLIVPSKLAGINYDNNQIVLEYSEDLAEAAIDKANLESQIELLETERDNLTVQLAGYTSETGFVNMYTLLIEAVNSYINNDFDQALVLLSDIDKSLLQTQTAKDVYSVMYEYCSGGVDKFVISGVKAYREGDYDAAISYLSAAKVSDETNDEAAYYLGLSYDESADVENAIIEYSEFLQKFPVSTFAADVSRRLNALTNTQPETETPPADAQPSGEGEQPQEQPQEQQPEPQEQQPEQ